MRRMILAVEKIARFINSVVIRKRRRGFQRFKNSLKPSSAERHVPEARGRTRDQLMLVTMSSNGLIVISPFSTSTTKREAPFHIVVIGSLTRSSMWRFRKRAP